MNKNKIGYFIIGSTIIWGAIILGCSISLKGTDCYPQIQNILALGFIAHLLFIWGPLVAKTNKENSEK